MTETGVLFTVRNNFYLGAYQAAIAEASDLEDLTDTEKVERDIYVYRAYIELGSYELVINEVSDTSSQALQAVKLLAQYSGAKAGKETTLSTLSEWLSDPASSNSATVLLVASIIYANEGNYVEALKACHTGLSLEMLALSVQVCLKIERVDQAEKQLKAMSAMDDDATLTQLATAWVNFAMGGAKVQEACFIYQELGERYNWTVRLYNSSAVCNMRMGEWDEADKQLHEAYEKDAKNPETLANLITAGLHQGKSISRYTNQLRSVAPQYAAVQKSDKASELFDQVSAVAA